MPRPDGTLTDEEILFGTGEDWPLGILIPGKPKPQLCEVACPDCRARQSVPKLPAECRECGRRFHKTGPIRRESQ